tara:strand:- start:666 stop:932 length:267 start_codon:yes stop_codon:yes gene_type:complete
VLLTPSWLKMDVENGLKIGFCHAAGAYQWSRLDESRARISAFISVGKIGALEMTHSRIFVEICLLHYRGENRTPLRTPNIYLETSAAS